MACRSEMVNAVDRFEVVWGKGIVHRGSADFDDKLVGKAKKGEILEGRVVQSESNQLKWLECEFGVYVPFTSPDGQIPLLKPLNSISGPGSGGTAGVAFLELRNQMRSADETKDKSTNSKNARNTGSGAGRNSRQQPQQLPRNAAATSHLRNDASVFSTF